MWTYRSWVEEDGETGEWMNEWMDENHKSQGTDHNLIDMASQRSKKSYLN